MALNVVLKATPKGDWDGFCTCDIGAEGLMLMQGKKRSLSIPIGSAAEYKAGRGQVWISA